MQVSLRHHFSGVTFVSFVSNKLRYNGEKNAMFSPSDLFLRSSVIGGETREGDYQIIWDDIPIGRVYSTHGVGGHEIWNWGVILPNVPQRPEHRGSSSDLESAKAHFRETWLRVDERLSEDEIAEARRISQDRSRPWHKRSE
jgi:hypothetical protein